MKRIAKQRARFVPGLLVKVVPEAPATAHDETRGLEGEVGLVTKPVENYLGSENFIEVLINEKLHEIHCMDLEILEEEEKKHMSTSTLEKFMVNFGSVVRSVDPGASVEEQGEAIVVSSLSKAEELTQMLPEDFYDMPVIVVDLSLESEES